MVRKKESRGWEGVLNVKGETGNRMRSDREAAVEQWSGGRKAERRL